MTGKKKNQIYFLCEAYTTMPEFPQFFLQAYKNSPVIDKVREAGAHPTALITNNFTVRTVPSIHLFPNTKTVFEGEDGIQKFLDMYATRPLAQERATKEEPTPPAEETTAGAAKAKAKPVSKPKAPAKPVIKKESTKDVTSKNSDVVRDVKPVPKTTTTKKTRKQQ
jgi:outer membrane biosynthesis protein TonB